MCLLYEDRASCQFKLVFEVKSAVDFLSPYIYYYRFGRSSSTTQDLARENDLPAWPIGTF